MLKRRKRFFDAPYSRIAVADDLRIIILCEFRLFHIVKIETGRFLVESRKIEDNISIFLIAFLIVNYASDLTDITIVIVLRTIHHAEHQNNQFLSSRDIDKLFKRQLVPEKWFAVAVSHCGTDL